VIKVFCTELRLSHAVDHFTRHPVTLALRYIRLHEIAGYRYRYSDAGLDRLAEWCREESYVMLKNMA
jgi:uncharacterized protein YecE (DUF72 family)